MVKMDTKTKTKFIILNGVEYLLPEAVWEFLLSIESEREYYMKKYRELGGSKELTTLQQYKWEARQ